MVEPKPHHPKVKGSSRTTPADIAREMAKNVLSFILFLLFIYPITTVVEHNPLHPKIEGSSLTTAADIAREMAKNVLSFILMVIIYVPNNHSGGAQASSSQG